MAAGYLHGVETTEVERGPLAARAVQTAVIGLVGTAPMGPVGTVTLVSGERDAAAFGAELAGFTIPQALADIYAGGVGTVLVINVLDPEEHKTTVANEALTFGATTSRAKLANAPVLSLTLTNTAGDVTYVAGTDYTLNAQTGEITRLAEGGIAAGASVKALSYDYLDPTLVTAADVIGTVDEAGQRTGIKALGDTYNVFGFDAKILIAPVYGTQNSVRAELESMIAALGAVAYVDAPVGTTFAQALAGRGPAGTINFNTGSDRVRLCYPHVKVWDTLANAERLEPLSAIAAGLRAKVDMEESFSVSMSNHVLPRVIGVERSLTARIDDPNSEVNQLNAAGITTVFSGYGTGYKLWGNRTAAWPSVTHPRNFETTRRTGDILNERIRSIAEQFVDKPMSPALMDALLDSINGLGRQMTADGDLLGFSAWIDPARNDVTQLGNGELLVSYKYTVPPPLERQTYETEITSEYLVVLTSGA